MQTSSPLSGKKLAIVVNDVTFFLSHRLNIAQAARDQGMQVLVLAPDNPAATSLAGMGLTFIPWEVSRWGANPFAELSSLLRLAKLYRQYRPDLVHHVTIKPVIYGSFAARLAGIAARVNAISGLGQVFTACGFSAELRRALVKRMYRVALNLPGTAVIFQNRDDRQAFLDAHLVDSGKTVLIPGAGVDTTALSPQPEAQGLPVVLFASRLLVEKGVREFVAAAQQLKSAGVSARFVLAGQPVLGNPGSIGMQEYERWRERGVVDCVGHRGDIAELLHASHVVCLPSYYGEGVPKILIEAASCGRAIVTTDWPGCRDIVEHERTGLLVPIRDSNALAQAIQRLLANAEERRSFGARGRQKVLQEGFGEDAVVGRTLELYGQLLQSLPHSPAQS